MWERIYKETPECLSSKKNSSVKNATMNATLQNFVTQETNGRL